MNFKHWNHEYYIYHDKPRVDIDFLSVFFNIFVRKLGMCIKCVMADTHLSLSEAQDWKLFVNMDRGVQQPLTLDLSEAAVI